MADWKGTKSQSGENRSSSASSKAIGLSSRSGSKNSSTPNLQHNSRPSQHHRHHQSSHQRSQDAQEQQNSVASSPSSPKIASLSKNRQHVQQHQRHQSGLAAGDVEQIQQNMLMYSSPFLYPLPSYGGPPLSQAYGSLQAEKASFYPLMPPSYYNPFMYYPSYVSPYMLNGQVSEIDTVFSSRDGITLNQVRYPRGPPRKPSMSNYTLWIGNLPPFVTIKEMMALFGTMEIQSIFLIQRTNCAFVNYTTRNALDQGYSKSGAPDRCFLRGLKLQVRYRDETSQKRLSAPDDAATDSESDPNQSGKQHTTRSASRYFICKSLTIEDIQAAERVGEWSTQAHNVPVLNEAFHSADNVYLFFSANRTGEFYGYARMESAIDLRPDSSDNLESAPPGDGPESSEVQTYGSGNVLGNSTMPRIISTKEDPSIPIPAGHIVDDSARGSLFWEVDTSPHSTNKSAQPQKQLPGQNDRIIPFKIHWLSRHSVSFKDSQHIYNALNGGKSIKIARDGTEVDEEAGKSLIELFESV
uniref:ARAD1B17270p n=1 Tax=Blastobotrys adeninivorans TaxID=409370 RepID=A0A060TCL2_BLAAD